MGGTDPRVYLLSERVVEKIGALGYGLKMLNLLSGLIGDKNVSLMALTVELKGSAARLDIPLADKVDPS